MMNEMSISSHCFVLLEVRNEATASVGFCFVHPCSTVLASVYTGIISFLSNNLKGQLRVVV
jgi:hypothetical protein